MANEFIARKGIISLDSIQVSGSITATGGITVSGSISSASFATSAATASSADNFFVRQNLTASSALFTGSITAQTLVVQTVTSSVVYSSGSNVFGNDVANTQTFTGSMLITGSVRTAGNICATGTGCFSVVCSPTYVGGTVSGNTIYGSTAICGGVICGGATTLTGALSGTSATFSSTAYTNLTMNGTNATGWGNNIAFQSGGTDFGYVGSYGSLVGSTTKDMTVWATSGNGFRVNVNGGSSSVLTIASTGAATFSGQVTISTSSSPGLNISKDASVDNRYIRFTNTQASSKNWDIINRPNANGNELGFYNDTDAIFALRLASTGAATFSSSVTAAGATFSGTTAVASAGATSQVRIDRSGAVARIQNYDNGSAANISLAWDGGNIGIGTASPSYLLTLVQSTSGNMMYIGQAPTNTSSLNATILLQSGTIPQSGGDQTGEAGLIFNHSYGTGGVNGNACGGYIKSIRTNPFGVTSDVCTALVFATANGNVNNERMRITSGGNVGIGTTSPCAKLHIQGSANLEDLLYFCAGGSVNTKFVFNINSGADDAFILRRNHTTQGNLCIMSWTYNGYVGVRTMTPSYALQVNGPSNSNAAYFRAGGTSGYASVAFSGESGTAIGVLATTAGCIYLGRANGTIGNQFGAEDDIMINCANGNVKITQSLTVGGALSKGSGSFRIKHPLLSKKCTHQLVHSFIEGPQADLIYRGKASLINGIACIDIDCAARMTQGTFEALNRCIQVFTTNESSWDQVRGKVIGNILVIESQNSDSIDDISWMVIGERQDEHMLETEWTDNEGRVITEPEIL